MEAFNYGKLKSQEKSDLFLTCFTKALTETVGWGPSSGMPKAYMKAGARGNHLMTSATSPDTPQQARTLNTEISSCNDQLTLTESELTKVYIALTSMDMLNMMDLHYESDPENADSLITHNQKTVLYNQFDIAMKYVKYLLINPNVPLTSFTKLSYFNKVYEEWVFFNIVFNWFYHPRMGFYVFKLFKNTIKTEQEKAFFKTYFLRVQARYKHVFSRKSAITSFTGGLAGLFFDETVLNRTIRLVMHIYNASFWTALKPNQKFVFLTALIKKVRKEATYNAINQLFEPISVEPSKSVLDQKINVLPISTVPDPILEIKSSSEPAAFKKYLIYLGLTGLICASLATTQKKDLNFASLNQAQLIRVDTPQPTRSLPFAALSVLAAAKTATGKMVATSSKEAASKTSSGLVKPFANSLDNPGLLFGSQFFTNLKDSSSLIGSPRDPAFGHSLEDGFQDAALLFGSELIKDLKDSISAPASPRGVFGHSLVGDSLYCQAMSKGLELLKQREKLEIFNTFYFEFSAWV